MNKWIAEFELEDGDTMPEHMDLEYKGVRIDFHCKPQNQDPCSTCGYEEGSIYCKEHCPHEAKAEQEPCGDVISRENAIIRISWDFPTLEISKVKESLDKLPSVTPKPKTGYWIDDNENEIDAQYGRHLYKCSKCNEYADMFVGGTEDWWDIEKPNYCPNCGCRMVEPQERSGEE